MDRHVTPNPLYSLCAGQCCAKYGTSGTKEFPAVCSAMWEVTVAVKSSGHARIAGCVRRHRSSVDDHDSSARDRLASTGSGRLGHSFASACLHAPGDVTARIFRSIECACRRDFVAADVAYRHRFPARV
tara:strand:- start:1671 stop:2057 length:387 start_codon:yes stop_codon:yes gene_type:complete